MRKTIEEIEKDLAPYLCGIFGDKKKMLRAILGLIPPGADVIAESNGGSGIVTAALKRTGRKVVTNDIMHFANLRLRVLVANNGTTLDSGELEMLATPNPDAATVMREEYPEFLGDANAALLDNWAANIPRLGDPLKRDIAVFLPVAMIMKAIPHNRQCTCFSPGGTLTGNRHIRNVDLLRMTSAFARDVFPGLLHDNGRDNEVRCMDSVDFVSSVTADILYSDPPYCVGTGDYQGKLHLFEKLTLILCGRAGEIRRFRTGKATTPPCRDWVGRPSAMVCFADLFRRSVHIPLLIVSYNRDSDISPEEIKALAEVWGWRVRIVPIPNYRRPTVVKNGKSKTEEVLLECRL